MSQDPFQALYSGIGGALHLTTIESIYPTVCVCVSCFVVRCPWILLKATPLSRMTPLQVGSFFGGHEICFGPSLRVACCHDVTRADMGLQMQVYACDHEHTKTI